MCGTQVDIKNRRHLLKRIRYEDLKPEQLFVGGTVTVYSRQLKIIGYGDEYTRQRYETKEQRCQQQTDARTCTQKQLACRVRHCSLGVCAPSDVSCFAAARTLAMVKPDAFKHLGKILNAIYESGFRIK